MLTSYKLLKENLNYIILIIIIFFISYTHLFLGGNFFNSHEPDIHVMYDYLSRSNLGGWRLDKIIGSNMHMGDPSYNAWSILSLIYNLPLNNKLILHNLVFIILNLYAAFALFYLINFVNPKLNKLYSSLLSCLIFITILRLEFNYIYSWVLVYPTIIFTCSILYNYFQFEKK